MRLLFFAFEVTRIPSVSRGIIESVHQTLLSSSDSNPHARSHRLAPRVGGKVQYDVELEIPGNGAEDEAPSGLREASSQRECLEGAGASDFLIFKSLNFGRLCSAMLRNHSKATLL